MKDLDAILAMQQAEQEGTYVVALRGFSTMRLEIVELDTQELAIKLLEALFLPGNKEKLQASYDYVAIWQGHKLFAARLSNGHTFNRQTFQRYLEEMDI